jgi:MAF protein
MVRRLSSAKAQAAARAFPKATVIGADTIVVLDGMVLGKPSTAEEAVTMLRALRGRAHEVLSAVTLCQGDRRSLQCLNRSRVWMRAYSDEESAAYVASGDPLDKAGAYAIQHPWFRPATRWEGCYASVMGLPLADVAALLKQAGWEVPVPVAQACRSEIEMTCCQEQESSSGSEIAI